MIDPAHMTEAAVLECCENPAAMADLARRLAQQALIDEELAGVHWPVDVEAFTDNHKGAGVLINARDTGLQIRIRILKGGRIRARVRPLPEYRWSLVKWLLAVATTIVVKWVFWKMDRALRPEAIPGPAMDTRENRACPARQGAVVPTPRLVRVGGPLPSVTISFLRDPTAGVALLSGRGPGGERVGSGRRGDR